MNCCNKPMELLNNEYICLECFHTHKNKEKNFHLTCCNNDTVIIENLRTCLNCGLALEELVLVDDKIFDKVLIKRCIYKRTKYLKLKLDFYNGKCFINLDDVINKLKILNFETIYELKKLIKKNKLNKYFKYIYHIYFLIKGKKLINLNYSDKERIVNYFIKFENIFKSKFKNKRNIYSYPVILQSIMEKFNIKGSDYILLPYKSKYIKKTIEPIIKLL